MTVTAAATAPPEPAQKEIKPLRQRHPVRFLVLAGLLVLLLLVVAPLLVVALNAVKSPTDYAGNGPLSWPSHLYWDGIVSFWNRVNFGQKLWNSFISSLVVAVLGVVLSILNAYALGIGKVKGRVWFLVFLLPLVFLISNDKQTVPVALGVLQGERLMDVTTTSASALIGILPAMLFFLIFQRTLTRGITAGAIK